MSLALIQLLQSRVKVEILAQTLSQMLHWGPISSFRRSPRTGADNLPEVLCILQPSFLLSSSEAHSENTRSAPRHGAILATGTSCLSVLLGRQYLLLDASPFALLREHHACSPTCGSSHPVQHLV